MIDLNLLIRENVRELKPYSSARDEFTGKAEVYLDANENPFNTGINRYPDPYQHALKSKIAEIKGIPVENMLLGNGSDEVLDLLFRAFCNPKSDNCVYTRPSYGMYRVLSGINDVMERAVMLNEDFDLSVDALISRVDTNTKLIFLCSPNNPSGNDLSREKILQLLSEVDCLVVVDEAYIDFSTQKSLVCELNQYKNLIVCQTLSKAWGMAGIRLGMCFASEAIINVLNKIKPPYNINELTQSMAIKMLSDTNLFEKNLKTILSEKTTLESNLKTIGLVQKIFPSQANFLLVRFDRSDELFHYLLKLGIIVRKRSSEPMCDGCLRLTVGLPEENEKLIKALKAFK